MLSERWKTLSSGDRVQRDLYSAFLLMNSADKEHSDRALCDATFENFKRLHDAEVTRIQNDGKKHLSSFGIEASANL